MGTREAGDDGDVRGSVESTDVDDPATVVVAIVEATVTLAVDDKGVFNNEVGIILKLGNKTVCTIIKNNIIRRVRLRSAITYQFRYCSQ